jgi:hypothetical protein
MTYRWIDDQGLLRKVLGERRVDPWTAAIVNVETGPAAPPGAVIRRRRRFPYPGTASASTPTPA